MAILKRELDTASSSRTCLIPTRSSTSSALFRAIVLFPGGAFFSMESSVSNVSNLSKPGRRCDGGQAHDRKLNHQRVGKTGNEFCQQSITARRHLHDPTAARIRTCGCSHLGALLLLL